MEEIVGSQETPVVEPSVGYIPHLFQSRYGVWYWACCIPVVCFIVVKSAQSTCPQFVLSRDDVNGYNRKNTQVSWKVE